MNGQEMWDEVTDILNKKMVYAHKPEYIKDINNPSQQLQVVALVDSCGAAIKWIKNPSKDSILFALATWPETLDYLEECNQDIHVYVMKTHYEKHSTKLKALKAFRDEAYFTYIKLISKV